MAAPTPGQYWIPDGTPTTNESYTPLLPINVQPYLLPNGVVGVPYNFNINYPEPPPETPIASLFVFKGNSGFLPPDFGGVGNYLEGFGAPYPALPSPPAWGSNYIQMAGVPTTPGVYLNYVKVTVITNLGAIAYSERLFQITILDSKKKPRGISAPPTICCNSNIFKDGVCPPQVISNGQYYQRIGESNCYIKTRRK